MLSAYQCQVVAYVDEYHGNIACLACARKVVDNDVLWFKHHERGLDDLVTADGEQLRPLSRYEVSETYAHTCSECWTEFPATCDACGADID